jgi:hypothetical protein
MGTSLPADPSPIFTTTSNDTSRSPTLVYPNDGVLFPPNITRIEIHFQPGSSSNTPFEVSLSGPIVTVNAFVRCTAPSGINGCIYLPDAGLWSSVATGNAGQGMVSLVVRGTDDDGTAGAAPDTSCDPDTDPTAMMFLTTFAGLRAYPAHQRQRSRVADGTTTALTNSFPRSHPSPSN